MSTTITQQIDLEKLKQAIDEVVYTQIDSTILYYVQSCVNCKACEAGCPFSADGLEYSPVNKAEITRQLVRARFTVWGMTIGRVIGGAKKYLKLDEAQTLADYVWHCTNCGSCMFVCPMAIDSGALIELMKQISFKAGIIPKVYKELEDLEVSEKYWDIKEIQDIWNGLINKIGETIGKSVQLDKKNSEILLYSSLYEALVYPDVIIKTAKILDMLGKDWTFMSKPLGIRPPIGIVIGDSEGSVEVMKRIYEYFKEINPKYVIMTSGGYDYPTLRYRMHEILKVKPNYEVAHITEALAKWYEEGEFEIEQLDEVITWHDPCQLSKRGGVIEPPRVLLKALSKKFKELPNHGVNTLCCSGGGGSCSLPSTIENLAKMIGYTLDESDEKFLEDRVKSLKNAGKKKIEEINKIKPQKVLTGCPVCKESIGFSIDYYKADSKVYHIVEILADRIKVKGK